MNISRLEMFLTFLLDSCHIDLEEAIEVAEDHSLNRSLVKLNLARCRARFEMTAHETRRQLGGDSYDRAAIIKSTIKRSTSALGVLNHVITIYREQQASTAVAIEAAAPFIQSMLQSKDKIEAQWKELVVSVKAATVYRPLSDTDRKAILQAMAFSSTGHFYVCPNGHPYVIADVRSFPFHPNECHI